MKIWFVYLLKDLIKFVFILVGFDILKIKFNVVINEILLNMFLNYCFVKCVIKIENFFVLKLLYMYIKRFCFKMK